jgi:predicted nucleic acid-binding protein
MIVVDANIIAYFWIPGDFTGLARRLPTIDRHWITVSLWRSELRSIVTQYVRRSLMTEAVAMEVLSHATDQMWRNECAVSHQAVMTEVFASSATAYDCEYIALAREEGVPLVTCDRDLIRKFPNIAIDLKKFVAGN